MKNLKWYHWFNFSRTKTFGWYLSIISFFTVKEYELYIQNTMQHFIYLSYSVRDSGFDKKSDMFYECKSVVIILFFIKIIHIRFSKKYISIEEYTGGFEEP